MADRRQVDTGGRPTGLKLPDTGAGVSGRLDGLWLADPGTGRGKSLADTGVGGDWGRGVFTKSKSY